MRKMIFAGAIAAAMTLAFAASAAPPAPKLEDKYAQNGDVKIHYVVEGKGPLVVLVHGFPDYWATWKPLMATLSAAGYRTAYVSSQNPEYEDFGTFTRRAGIDHPRQRPQVRLRQWLRTGRLFRC